MLILPDDTNSNIIVMSHQGKHSRNMNNDESLRNEVPFWYLIEIYDAIIWVIDTALDSVWLIILLFLVLKMPK